MPPPDSHELREACELADVQSVGIYRTVKTHLTLAFVEPNAFRMDYRWSGTIETVTPVRFFERRSGWSGKGIEGPPKVHARVAGKELRARRHGSVYRSGDYEKYLIDLGEDVSPDSLIDISTESRYVDEGATFKPFLSAKARPSFQELSLTIESVEPFEQCDYVHFGENSEQRTSNRIDDAFRDGLHIYSVGLAPVPPGRHQLKWKW